MMRPSNSITWQGKDDITIEGVFGFKDELKDMGGKFSEERTELRIMFEVLMSDVTQENTTIDTKKLRDIVSEVLGDALSDIPRIPQVETMIEDRIGKARQEVKVETSTMIDEKLTPFSQRLESWETRFNSFEQLLSSSMSNIQATMQQVVDSVTSNNNTTQQSFDRLSRRVSDNDKRLDHTEPLAEQSNKILMGDTDGTLGLRVQVQNLYTGQATIKTDVMAIKGILETQELRRQAWLKYIKFVSEFAITQHTFNPLADYIRRRFIARAFRL